MCLILRPAEQAGEVRESSDGFRCAVVNGLEGVCYAVSDGSLVLNKTLKEFRRMQGDITRVEEMLEMPAEIKRMEKTILQFHSENQKHYGEFLSKLDGIQMGVAQLQVNHMLS